MVEKNGVSVMFKITKVSEAGIKKQTNKQNRTTTTLTTNRQKLLTQVPDALVFSALLRTNRKVLRYPSNVKSWFPKLCSMEHV